MADKFRFEPTPLDQLQSHYDVVIVGSGGTGLTSAIRAHELGLSPVVLEKMPQLGGNTTRASSGMNAADTEVQRKHHIKDTVASFYHDTFVGGGEQNNPELLKYFTENGADAIDWLMKHGIVLDDLTITGGMSTMRTHRPSSMAPIGGYLVTELLKLADKAELPIFTEMHVDRLLTTGDAVTGVEVTTGDETHTITADAVVLATGGFGANEKLLTRYRPELAGYRTTNQPGATGDGLQLARQAGAELVDMKQVQVHPTVQQDTDHAFLIGEAVRGEGAVLVDRQGKRFVNELATRKVVTAAIEYLDEKGAYLIFDQSVRDRVKAIEFYDHVGLVTTGATLAELAEKVGFDAETLAATVTTWNAAVTTKHDGAFGRTTGLDRELTQAPYFAIHVAPAVHYTMGGVRINAQTQVLREDGTPIAGLFAAGEVAGGLHGNNRIGGNSIAETVVFGLQSGSQVAAMLKA